MAEHLTVPPKRMTTCRLCLLGCLLLASVHVRAQALADPTRPPVSLGMESGAATTPAGPALQSVMISPRRTVAIINGETVKVGDKVGDAKVVKITETEVVLRNGSEVQKLKLYPDVEKLPASGDVSGKGRPSGNKGKQ